MNEPHDRRWLDSKANVDKIYWGVIGVCALLFLADAFYVKHPEFEMEYIFGFYGIFGFVACVGLVLIAKEMRRVLKRDEDYFEASDDETGTKDEN